MSDYALPYPRVLDQSWNASQAERESRLITFESRFCAEPIPPISPTELKKTASKKKFIPVLKGYTWNNIIIRNVKFSDNDR